MGMRTSLDSAERLACVRNVDIRLFAKQYLKQVFYLSPPESQQAIYFLKSCVSAVHQKLLELGSVMTEEDCENLVDHVRAVPEWPLVVSFMRERDLDLSTREGTFAFLRELLLESRMCGERGLPMEDEAVTVIAEMNLSSNPSNFQNQFFRKQALRKAALVSEKCSEVFIREVEEAYSDWLGHAAHFLGSSERFRGLAFNRFQWIANGLVDSEAEIPSRKDEIARTVRKEFFSPHRVWFQCGARQVGLTPEAYFDQLFSHWIAYVQGSLAGVSWR